MPLEEITQDGLVRVRLYGTRAADEITGAYKSAWVDDEGWRYGKTQPGGMQAAYKMVDWSDDVFACDIELDDNGRMRPQDQDAVKAHTEKCQNGWVQALEAAQEVNFCLTLNLNRGSCSERQTKVMRAA